MAEPVEVSFKVSSIAIKNGNVTGYEVADYSNDAFLTDVFRCQKGFAKSNKGS